MRNRFILCLISLGLFLPEYVGGQTKLGQWRTHLPYKYCILAEATDDRVFCSSTGGLFTYNLVDNSVEKLSKIDGLSDNGVSAMRWSDELETLILAYQNSNIDIIREGSILNIPDLMKKQIPGDKSIYDIYFYQKLAYLSTGFGIVVLNLEKDEIKETYYIGDNGDALKVNQVTVDRPIFMQLRTRVSEGDCFRIPFWWISMHGSLSLISQMQTELFQPSPISMRHFLPLMKIRPDAGSGILQRGMGWKNIPISPEHSAGKY